MPLVNSQDLFDHNSISRYIQESFFDQYQISQRQRHVKKAQMFRKFLQHQHQSLLRRPSRRECGRGQLPASPSTRHLHENVNIRVKKNEDGDIEHGGLSIQPDSNTTSKTTSPSMPRESEVSRDVADKQQPIKLQRRQNILKKFKDAQRTIVFEKKDVQTQMTRLMKYEDIFCKGHASIKE